MADKKEFVDALDAHARSVQEGIDEIGRTIKDNNRRIGDTEQERKKQIDEYVAALLPDLAEVTIQKLEHTYPGFTTVAQVRQMLTDARAPDLARRAELVASFNPATFTQTKTLLELKIKGEREILDTLKSEHERLERLPGFAALITSGYGTPEYPYRWWHMRYYRDWKAADAATASTGVANWKTLAAMYQQAQAGFATMQDSVDELELRLCTLTADHDRYNAIQAALDGASGFVLERLRIRLKAYIDGSSTDLGPGLNQVKVCRDRISALHTENCRLHETRSKLSEQLVGLHKMKSEAERSRSGTVPDKYVAALRRSQRMRRTIPSNGSRAVGVPPSLPDDDALVAPALFLEMTDYFDQAPAEHARDVEPEVEQSSHDTFVAETFAAAEKATGSWC